MLRVFRSFTRLHFAYPALSRLHPHLVLLVILFLLPPTSNLCQFCQNCLRPVMSQAVTNATQPCLHLEHFLQLKKVITFNLLTLAGSPLVIIGIFTSMLSFAMFTRDRVTPKTTRFMLKAVSIADTLFLILFILYIHVHMFGKKFYKSPANGTSVVPFFATQSYQIPVIFLLQVVEIYRNWLTVLIGLERLVVVCIPLQAPQLCTKRRTVAICCTLFFFAIAVRTPLLLRRIYNITNNKIVEEHMKTLHDTLDVIFMLIVPFFILICCTGFIIRNLRKSADCMCGNTTQHARDLHKRNVKVTWMLLAVIIIFGICTIPYIIYTASKFLKTCSAKYMVRLVLPFCWFGTLVYSTSNFFVYVVFMRKYRQILLRMFRRRREPYHTERTNEYTLVYRNSVPSVRRC